MFPSLPPWLVLEGSTVPAEVRDAEAQEWAACKALVDPRVARYLAGEAPAPGGGPGVPTAYGGPMLWQPLVPMAAQPTCVKHSVLYAAPWLRRAASYYVCMEPPANQPGLTRPRHNAALISALKELLEIYESRADEHDFFRASNMKKTLGVLATFDKELTKESLQNIREQPHERIKWLGLGEKTLKKIEEFLEKGTITALEASKDAAALAAKQRELQRVWGVGRAKAGQLLEAGISSIAQLRLRVFGDPSRGIQPNPPMHRLAHGRLAPSLSEDSVVCLEYLDDIESRIPRAEVEEIGDRVHAIATAAYGEGAFDMWLCGSYRRGKATCGDVDVLLVPAAKYPGHTLLSQAAFTEALRRDEEFVIRVLREGEPMGFAYDTGGYMFNRGRQLARHSSASSSSPASSASFTEHERAAAGAVAGGWLREGDVTAALLRASRGLPSFLLVGVESNEPVPAASGISGTGRRVALPSNVVLHGVHGSRIVATALAETNLADGGPKMKAAASSGGAGPSSFRGRGARGGRRRAAVHEAMAATRSRSRSVSEDTDSDSEQLTSSEGGADSEGSTSKQERDPRRPQPAGGGAGGGVSLQQQLAATDATPAPSTNARALPPLPPVPPDYSDVEFLPFRDYKTETLLLLVRLSAKAATEPRRLARRLDVKFCPRDVYPFALMSFTGTDHYNRSTRLWAHKCGWQLSDTALRPVLRVTQRVDGTAPFYAGHSIRVLSEADIATALGIPFKEPSERDWQAPPPPK